MDSQSPMFDCLLFDLDDTLYPVSTGIAAACKKNIDDYLALRFGFGTDSVSVLRSELYNKYGSSLVGLRVLGYEIDVDDYHRFVHGRLPYEFIKPDPALKSMLKSMPQRKLVFTNSDRAHAKTVLRKLDLEDCFEDMICFESINSDYDAESYTQTTTLYIKPSPEAMRRAIELANVDPHKTLFFDDNRRNTAAGKAAGLNTVLVGSATTSDVADYWLQSVHDVSQVIPEIWNSSIMSSGHEKPSCSIETVDSFEAAAVVA